MGKHLKYKPHPTPIGRGSSHLNDLLLLFALFSLFLLPIIYFTSHLWAPIYDFFQQLGKAFLLFIVGALVLGVTLAALIMGEKLHKKWNSGGDSVGVVELTGTGNTGTGSKEKDVTPLPEADEDEGAYIQHVIKTAGTERGSGGPGLTETLWKRRVGGGQRQVSEMEDVELVELLGPARRRTREGPPLPPR